MLSRCRQSMLICSSRKYLALPDVRGTLVGDVSYCKHTSLTPLTPLHSSHQDAKQSIGRFRGSVQTTFASGCGSESWPEMC